MENRTTIKYTITEEHFKYHLKKGEMIAKGCIISPDNHPVKEVEKIKKELLDRGKLSKVPEGYRLKSNYKTGLLMAYNLCSNNVEAQLKNKHTIVINGNEDNEIKDFFEIKNVMPSDLQFGHMIKKHEYRLEKIEKIFYNSKFFKRVQSKDFSTIESVVVECLNKVGYITAWRRGDDTEKEADIVIEDQNLQIEIVTSFNEANKIFRYGTTSSELVFALDTIDTDHYKVPEGVIKKFTEKEYTERYRKELAIVFLGSTETASNLLQIISNKLEDEHNVKNHYTKLHLIVINPMEDRVIYSTSEEKREVDLNISEKGLYSKRKISLHEVVDEEFYVVTCKNIFKNEKALLYIMGTELKQIITELNIWITA